MPHKLLVYKIINVLVVVGIILSPLRTLLLPHRAYARTQNHSQLTYLAPPSIQVPSCTTTATTFVTSIVTDPEIVSQTSPATDLEITSKTPTETSGITDEAISQDHHPTPEPEADTATSPVTGPPSPPPSNSDSPPEPTPVLVDETPPENDPVNQPPQTPGQQTVSTLYLPIVLSNGDSSTTPIEPNPDIRIASTLSITYGQIVTGSILTASETISYTFTGQAEDIVLLAMSDNDFWFGPEIRLYGSDGTLITSKAGGDYVELTQTLTIDDQYTLLIGDSGGTNTTGNYTLLLQKLNPPANSIPISYGDLITGDITLPAERDVYTFTGQAGDIVLLAMSDNDFWFGPEIRLYGSDGTLITSKAGGDYVELTQTLTIDDQYTLLIGDSGGTNTTGNYTLLLQKLNPPANSIPISYGDLITGDITLPAERDVYTFTGQAGDIVLLAMSDNDFWFGPEIRLYGSDGTLITSKAGGDYVELTQTLTIDDQYTLLIGDSGGTNTTGNYTLLLQKLNPPANSIPISYGDLITGDITLPAERDVYTFTGQAGDIVLLAMSDNDFWFGPEIRLYGSDGTLITSKAGGDYVELTQTLTIDDQYTLLIGDSGGTNTTGNYTLLLQKLNPPANSIPISYGDLITGDITLPAERDVYTFTGQAGDIVLLAMSDNDFWFGPEIRLYGSDGTLITSKAGGDYVELTQTLTIDDQYTLLIGDSGGTNTAGNYTLLLQKLNPPANSIPISYGDLITGDITLRAERDVYTFTGQAGDIVLLAMSDNDFWFGPEIRLYGSDGTLITSQATSGDYFELNHTLTADDEYTLLIGDNGGTDTASYTLLLQKLNPPANIIPISYGDLTTGDITLWAERDVYAFTGQAGDIVLLTMRDDDFRFDPEIRLYSSDGTLITSQASSGDHLELNHTLAADDNYTLLIGDSGGTDTTGYYALYLQSLNDPANVTSLFSGKTVTGSITATLDMDAYTFSVDKDTVYIIEANRLSGGLDPELHLYDPDGNLFDTGWGYPQAIISDTIATGGNHILLVGDHGGTETGTYSMTVTLIGPIPLALGETHADQIHQLESHYYAVQVPSAGEQVLVEVTPSVGTDQLWLEGRFGDVPFGGIYDLRSTNLTPQGTYELLIAPSQAGTYYFSVFGRTVNPSPGSYQITARTVARHLSNLAPRSAGNTGDVTLNVSGLGFANGVQIALRGNGLATLTADTVTVASATQLWAHFNLNSATVAPYDLVVTWPGGAEEILTDVFNVTTGQGPCLEAHILAPDTVRLNRKYVLWVDYANLGDSDMLAPLLIVSSPQSGVGLSLSPDGTFTKQSVQILGVNFDQPAGILPPGSNHRIPVYFQVTEPDTVHFHLDKMVADTTLIDWNVVEAEIRPVNAHPETWNAMFTQLQQQLGSTWASYLEVLTTNATRRAKRGDLTYEVRELFQDQMQQAYTGGDATIVGYVHLADGNQSLENVTVEARLTDGSYATSEVTDGNGQYFLPYLPSGSYDMQVKGYILDAPAQVSVVAGQDVLDADMTVRLGGQITGIVTIQGGGVLTGTVVIATDQVGNAYAASTDELGKYEIIGLPTETYSVRTHREMYATTEMTGIAVALGAATTGVDFVLDPGGTISGRVTAANNGVPIAEAQVIATTEAGLSLMAETDQNGDYSITQASSSTWELFVTAPGWVSSDPITIPLVAPNSVTQDFALISGAAFTGTVTDQGGQPIADATVIALGETGVGTNGTDATGKYQIDSLPAGTYAVEAFANGFVPQMVASQTITIGQTINNVDFSLSNGKILSGIVTEVDGITPIAGASISLQGNTGSHYVSPTATDGTFALNTLAPDVYLVEVSADNRISDLQMLQVPSTGTVPPLSVALTMGGSINGTVTLQDSSTPVTSSLVVASVSGVSVGVAVTDDSGQYSMEPLSPNIYTVAVFDDIRAFAPLEVTVTASNATAANFLAGTSVLRGTVTDASSTLSVAGTEVTAVLQGQNNLTPRVFTTTTNALGQYRFDYLRDGSYWVTVTTDNLARGTAAIIVSSPPTETVADFALDQALEIFGTVVQTATGTPIPDASIWIKSTAAPDDDPGQSARSDQNGVYQITNVVTGTYSIYVQAQDYVWEKQASIAVSSPGLEVNWALQSDGGRVQGQLTETASGLTVGEHIIILSGDDFALATVTDANGFFDFDAVPVGTWNLRALGASDPLSETVTVQILTDNITQDLSVSFIHDNFQTTSNSTEQGFGIQESSPAIFNTNNFEAFNVLATSQMGEITLSGIPAPPVKPSPPLCEDVNALYSVIYNFFRYVDDKHSDLKILRVDTEANIADYVDEIDKIDREIDEINAKILNIILSSAWSQSGVKDDLMRLAGASNVGSLSWWEKLVILASGRDDFFLGVVGLILKYHSEIRLLKDKQARFAYKIEKEILRYERSVDSYLFALGLYWDSLDGYELSNDGDCDDDDDPPDPPDEPVDDDTTEPVLPKDPNEKAGPTGVGLERLVNKEDQLLYTVYFENVITATAPAQEVFVNDTLNPNLDWASFQILEFAFDDTIIAAPKDKSSHSVQLAIPDYRPAVNSTWQLDISAQIDYDTGAVNWIFRTLDPLTDELPLDALVGFLPPEDGTGRGQGYVSFLVKPKPGVAVGTVLTNQASIVFDTNDPIVTNVVWNTIGAIVSNNNVYLPIVVKKN